MIDGLTAKTLGATRAAGPTGTTPDSAGFGGAGAGDARCSRRPVAALRKRIPVEPSDGPPGESPPRPRGRWSRGFSLLELMIAATLGCIAGGALFLLLHQIQGFVLHLDSMMERDQNAALAPVLLVNWIGPAGCGLSEEGESSLSVESGVLSVRADIDGPEGFPDGLLEGSFEAIQIRGAGGSLQLRSGGGTFQPFLKNVEAVRFSGPEGPLLRVEIESGGEAKSGSRRAGPRRTEVLVYLWNFAARPVLSKGR